MTETARCERVVAIDRESFDRSSGEFSAILATDGEASDGHILSIEGMTVPDNLPMLFRHDSTPEIPALGRIIAPQKSREGERQLLRVTGRFDLDGEPNDPLRAIRRGFASMVSNGTLDAMSVRWDGVPGKAIARSSLPKGHPAHVSGNTGGPARFGLFFEESVAREGSIVAIGADPSALVGRSRESNSAFERAFWTALAEHAEPEDGMARIDDDMLKQWADSLTESVRETMRAEFRHAFGRI